MYLKTLTFIVVVATVFSTPSGVPGVTILKDLGD